MVELTSRRGKSSSARTKKPLSVAAENSLMETAKLFQRDLTSTEYKLWTGILRDYTDLAVVWAFDNWNRNGKFFPKPAEIIELVHSFGSSQENQTKLCGHCKDGWVITNPEASPADYVMRRCECVEAAIVAGKVPTRADGRRYGSGYGAQDILWLLKRRQQDSTGKRWSIADWEALFAELDSKRPGGAPQFRKNPETRDFLRAE